MRTVVRPRSSGAFPLYDSGCAPHQLRAFRALTRGREVAPQTPEGFLELHEVELACARKSEFTYEER